VVIDAPRSAAAVMLGEIAERIVKAAGEASVPATVLE